MLRDSIPSPEIRPMPRQEGDPYRVALLSPYDLDVPGGVQGQVIGLARTLIRRGVETTVLAPGGVKDSDPTQLSLPFGDSDEVDIVQANTIQVGNTTRVPANGSVAPVALSPRTAFKAARVLSEGQFDVVHLHEPFAPAISYRWLTQNNEAATVGTLHRSGGERLYKVLGPIGRLGINQLDAVCVVSEEARQTAAPFLERKEASVLFNGIELPNDQELATINTKMQRQKPPVVIFPSRHEQRKGLSVLLEAWESDDLQSAECWVLSDGPETEALKQRYQDLPGVRWFGRVSETEKRNLLAQADILCAPSLGGESFGMVILEGLAFKSIVVASDIAGYRQSSDGHGILVSPGDPADLRAGLSQALSDIENRQGTAAPRALEAGAAHAASWSMDALTDRYLDVYDEAIDRHRHS